MFARILKGENRKQLLDHASPKHWCCSVEGVELSNSKWLTPSPAASSHARRWDPESYTWVVEEIQNFNDFHVGLWRLQMMMPLSYGFMRMFLCTFTSCLLV